MTTELSPLYCANHPSQETGLRCNRCEKPICSRCAVLTPTGYRCKQCIRSQQKVFENAEIQDYILGIIVAGVLSLLGSLLAAFLGWFVIFLGPTIGAGIAELTRKSIRRHRSRRLFLLVAGAAALGALAPAGVMLLFGILSSSIIWQAVYAFFITTTIYYRLSGIRL